ncbi:HAD-IB family hydrolase [Maritimibacter sp. 55A14]|uniref:HAD family hydrolase n=1 Tax=Maritimibacter sp. 55A14 TaxID=2174844 RepID=UPI000D612F46|nr:HAD-IB family hydrolase [Maritimibacter sp. 55A14]PWE34018.1 HAD-IB family hydrolase [Maritimibacter sp. 55A14]
MPGTAIFDLDRTVTDAPTWTRFLVFAAGGRPGAWLRAPMVALRAAGYRLGVNDRDAIKAASLGCLRGMDRTALERVAEEFVARELAGNLRPGARAAIEAHRAAGDRLVMATAAVDLIADPLGRALGFDLVIATRLDWSGGAPRLAGANCYGAEKLRRIADAGPFPPPVAAYSDHVSDLAMLLEAERGIAVNPSPALARAAAEHGLEVVDYGRPQDVSQTDRSRSA